MIPAAPASSVSKGKENVAIGAGAAGVPADKVGIVVPSSLANGTVNTLKAKRGGPKQPFPEDKVAAFLRHVHGSSKTRPVLVDEFVGLMKEQNTPIKKNTIEAKLKELDVKKVKGTNVVDAALLVRAPLPLTALGRRTDVHRPTDAVRHQRLRWTRWCRLFPFVSLLLPAPAFAALHILFQFTVSRVSPACTHAVLPESFHNLDARIHAESSTCRRRTGCQSRERLLPSRAIDGFCRVPRFWVCAGSARRTATSRHRAPHPI